MAEASISSDHAEPGTSSCPPPLGPEDEAHRLADMSSCAWDALLPSLLDASYMAGLGFPVGQVLRLRLVFRIPVEHLYGYNGWTLDRDQAGEALPMTKGNLKRNLWNCAMDRILERAPQACMAAGCALSFLRSGG
jgi:hypothetical protein